MVVGYGPWETPGTKTDELKIEDITERDGETRITATLLPASHEIWRPVAIDKRGNIHLSVSDYSSTRTRGTQRVPALFELPLAEIERFHFQTRKAQKVTFKHVSQSPDIITDVPVVTEDIPPQATSTIVNDPEYVVSYRKSRSASKKDAEATKDGQFEFDKQVGYTVTHTNAVVHCIDFDTDRFIQIPDNINMQDKEAFRLWTESEGVDAIIQSSSLKTVNMAAIGDGTEDWTKLNPNIISELKSAPLSGGKEISTVSGKYHFRPFKSSRGRIGVVGLSFKSNNSLWIKYKFLKFKAKPLDALNSRQPITISATAGNGAKVTVLGICEYSTDDKKWWSPNGNFRSSMTDVLRNNKHFPYIGYTEKTERCFLVVYQLTNPDSDPDHTSGQSHSKKTKVGNIEYGTRSQRMIDLNSWIFAYVFAIPKTIPVTNTTAELSFGVSFDENEKQWVTFKNVSINPGVKTNVYVEEGK